MKVDRVDRASSVDEKALVNEVVRRVVERLDSENAGGAAQSAGFIATAARAVGVRSVGAPSRPGVFDRIEDAVESAGRAFLDLQDLSVEARKACVASIRAVLTRHTNELSELAVRETGMGRVSHKEFKNRLAIDKTPGVEFVAPEVFTGDNGLALVEHPPYGVIGAITPSTNPSETVINNGIAMLAGGNVCVFNGHPSAAATTARTVELMNQAVVDAGGPPNLLTCAIRPTKETALALIRHPRIRVLVVTGGPQIVKIAMAGDKKVIAAGPGNPPVVVDETADLDRAARDIVAGASIDNNIVCVAEKEIIVVESIADRLIKRIEEQAAFFLSGNETSRLMDTIVAKTCDGVVASNRECVGRDVQVIMEMAGLRAPDDAVLAVAEVEASHPLVHWEQLMPVIPLVRVRDFDAALDLAYLAEGGRFHTAMLHSLNVDSMTRMAWKMNCTVFVKNGPCYAGLGLGGEGYTSWTLASPTGEGYTNPLTFTRHRRCTLTDHFRII